MNTTDTIASCETLIDVLLRIAKEQNCKITAEYESGMCLNVYGSAVLRERDIRLEEEKRQQHKFEQKLIQRSISLVPAYIVPNAMVPKHKPLSSTLAFGGWVRDPIFDYCRSR